MVPSCRSSCDEMVQNDSSALLNRLLRFFAICPAAAQLHQRTLSLRTLSEGSPRAVPRWRRRPTAFIDLDQAPRRRTIMLSPINTGGYDEEDQHQARAVRGCGSRGRFVRFTRMVACRRSFAVH